MANGHGGYRRPANPAPVSGPGALSRRTDGGTPHGSQPVRELPGAKYGEAKAFREAQQAAPMSEGPDLSSLVPFAADSQRPDEPITAGLSGGEGPGPTYPQPQLDQDLQDRMRSYLPVLIMLASDPDVNPATKQFVRQVRGEVG